MSVDEDPGQPGPHAGDTLDEPMIERERPPRRPVPRLGRVQVWDADSWRWAQRWDSGELAALVPARGPVAVAAGGAAVLLGGLAWIYVRRGDWLRLTVTGILAAGLAGGALWLAWPREDR